MNLYKPILFSSMIWIRLYKWSTWFLLCKCMHNCVPVLLSNLILIISNEGLFNVCFNLTKYNAMWTFAFESDVMMAVRPTCSIQ